MFLKIERAADIRSPDRTMVRAIYGASVAYRRATITCRTPLRKMDRIVQLAGPIALQPGD